jgi:signal transduction histidine kinase
VTTLQAAAARQLLTADDADAIAGTDLAFVGRALAAIEETGRSAMADLDTVLGVLRDDHPRSATTRRSLRDLGRLLDETGAMIDLRVDGRLDGVPPVASREGYRIVQESLTNAQKHGGDGAARLRLAYTPAGLEIEVANVAGPDTGEGGGHGLVGMRERASAVGGTLRAGRVDGRFVVTAFLPAPAWQQSEPALSDGLA